MVCDVLLSTGKRLRVGEGVMQAGGPFGLTEIGGRVLARLLALDASDKAPVQLLLIGKVESIGQKLTAVFTSAPEKSLIMILCGSPAFIDGLMGYLEWDSPATTFSDTAIPDRRPESDPHFMAINAELAPMA